MYLCGFLKIKTDETVLNNMFFFNCKSSLPHKNIQNLDWTKSFIYSKNNKYSLLSSKWVT